MHRIEKICLRLIEKSNLIEVKIGRKVNKSKESSENSCYYGLENRK